MIRPQKAYPLERLPNLRTVDAWERQGQAYALNLGVRAAKGEAMPFCNDTDYCRRLQHAGLAIHFAGCCTEGGKPRIWLESSLSTIH